jgi:hypothetical protein
MSSTTFVNLHEVGKKDFLAIKDLNSFDALISEQPIDGLLYDLNLLPEVISTRFKKGDPAGQREWTLMLTIVRLREILAKKIEEVNNAKRV